MQERTQSEIAWGWIAFTEKMLEELHEINETLRKCLENTPKPSISLGCRPVTVLPEQPERMVKALWN